MKKLLLACCLIPSYCMAQLPDSATICFQPDSAIGQDAYIFKLDNNCIPNATPAPYGGNTPGAINFGNATELAYAAWTWNAWKCPAGEIRGLIRFDQLSQIPSNSIIQSATLSLHGIPSTTNWWGDNQFPGTSLNYDNSGWLNRITSAWNEHTVSWTGTYPIPSTTTVGQKAIAASGSQWNWNTTVDVKSLVQGITNGTNPNYGWMLQLQNEAHYRETVFATSDNPVDTLRPKLCVTYKRCSDFQYCYSSNHPYVFTFTAMHPMPGYTSTWVINNGIWGTGNTLTFDFSTLGAAYGSVFNVTLISSNGVDTCRKLNTICMPAYSTDTCSAFKVCRNTEAPYTANITALTTAPGGYHYVWFVYGGSTTYPSGINGNSAVVTVSGSTQLGINLNITNITTGQHLCDSTVNTLCFSTNQLKENNLNLPNDPSVYQSTEMVHQDDVVFDAVSISPNPTKDVWSFNFNSNEAATADLKLYDLMGRLVFEQKSNLQKGSNRLTIGSPSMPDGIYIIKGRLGETMINQKVIKLH